MDFFQQVDSTGKYMAATESTMLPLGTAAPAFELPDVATADTRSLEDIAQAEPVLVVFLCAHCPYVLHVAPEMARIAREYANKPIKFVGITSNDIVQYPQDSPDNTARFTQQHGLLFPILFDESQRVAQAYSAACTPDFFLFDKHHHLFYRGQMDATRPGRGEPHGTELRSAIDAVIGDKSAPEHQHPSLGCNIKWKVGNEPVRISLN